MALGVDGEKQMRIYHSTSHLSGQDEAERCSRRARLGSGRSPLHLPRHWQLGQLAVCPDHEQLQQQRPRNRRELGGDPVLRAQPRHGSPRHLQRLCRPDHRLQVQQRRFPPGPHVLLHRQGPGRPDRRHLGRQRRRVDQDLPGDADFWLGRHELGQPRHGIRARDHPPLPAERRLPAARRAHRPARRRLYRRRPVLPLVRPNQRHRRHRHLEPAAQGRLPGRLLPDRPGHPDEDLLARAHQLHPAWPARRDVLSG